MHYCWHVVPCLAEAGAHKNSSLIRLTRQKFYWWDLRLRIHLSNLFYLVDFILVSSRMQSRGMVKTACGIIVRFLCRTAIFISLIIEPGENDRSTHYFIYLFFVSKEDPDGCCREIALLQLNTCCTSKGCIRKDEILDVSITFVLLKRRTLGICQKFAR